MSERWTEFQGMPNKADKDRPRVTLSNKSVLRMNPTAFEAFGMPATVKLSYEEHRRIIGLGPTDPQCENAFPV